MENIQKILRTIRTIKGLSQEDIANELDIDVSTYTKYETGKINLTLDRLQQIADIFKMDLVALLTYQEGRSLYQVAEEREQYQAKDSLLKDKEKEIKLLNKIISLLEEKEGNSLKKLFQALFISVTGQDLEWFDSLIKEIRENQYEIPPVSRKKFDAFLEMVIGLLQK